MLKTLTPREEKVLRTRFGIGEKSDHTVEGVGQDFEVRVPFANWILREGIRQLGHQDASDVHVCSMEELEYLQRQYWGGSMFTALRAKRLSSESSNKDFRDWLAEQGTASTDQHPLLVGAFERLLPGILTAGARG